MTLQAAKELLSKADRYELRDHAFGDAEVTWAINGEEVAGGYFGKSSDVWVEDVVKFSGKEADELRQCGKFHIERNDETGPDEFVQGKTMPGLTLEGVRKEICKWRQP